MRGFLALVLLGCGCVAPQGPGAAPARAAAFDQAQAAIARGDWEDAAVLLGRFVHRDPSHALAAHARYLLGVYYLRAGDYDAAEEEFAYVGGHAASPRLARQARIRAADAARGGREVSRAAEMYARLCADADSRGDAAELMFKLGLARRQEGRWDEAGQLFERVRRLYGRSPYAERAAAELAAPRHFALQLASYGERETAERKSRLIEAKGLAAAVVPAVRGSKPVFCVRVGSFPTRAKALDFKNQVRDDPDFRAAEVVP